MSYLAYLTINGYIYFNNCMLIKFNQFWYPTLSKVEKWATLGVPETE